MLPLPHVLLLPRGRPVGGAIIPIAAPALSVRSGRRDGALEHVERDRDVGLGDRLARVVADPAGAPDEEHRRRADRARARPRRDRPRSGRAISYPAAETAAASRSRSAGAISTAGVAWRVVHSSSTPRVSAIRPAPRPHGRDASAQVASSGCRTSTERRASPGTTFGRAGLDRERPDRRDEPVLVASDPLDREDDLARRGERVAPALHGQSSPRGPVRPRTSPQRASGRRSRRRHRPEDPPARAPGPARCAPRGSRRASGRLARTSSSGSAPVARTASRTVIPSASSSSSHAASNSPA